MRVQILVTSVLAAALGAAACGGFVGSEFPDFQAKDAVTNEAISLKALRGKVVLVDFWATWCGPCVADMPHVKDAYRKFHDQGLEIISISLDSDRDRFERFVQREHLEWSHVMEGGGWGTRLAGQYGVRSIPKVFVIDHNGICVSDSARGRALESVLESRAIQKLPPSEGSRGQRPATGPAREAEPAGKPAPAATAREAEQQQLKQELAATSDRLDHASLPLKELADRLDDAERALRAAIDEANAPRDQTSLAQACADLHEKLERLRHDLFVLGLVNDTPLSLSSLAAAGQAGSPSASRSAITSGRSGLRVMRKSAEGSLELWRGAQRGLDSVGQRIDAGKAAPDQVRSACREASKVAAALDDRFADGWQEQLVKLGDVLDRWFRGAKDLDRVERLRGEIAAMHRELEASRTNAERLPDLEKRFEAACREILAVVDEKAP